MTEDRHPLRRFVRLDVDDPETLKRLVRGGLIWRTSYVERGISAVRSGLVDLADCRDVPEAIRAR